MKNTILFDSRLKCKSGAWIPTCDSIFTDDEFKDQELHWFHEGYGTFRLYKLHQVDDNIFIAESMKKTLYKLEDKFESWIENPELALR